MGGTHLMRRSHGDGITRLARFGDQASGAFAVILIQQQIIKAIRAGGVGLGARNDHRAIGISRGQRHHRARNAGFARVAETIGIQVFPHQIAGRAGLDVIAEVSGFVGLAASHSHRIANHRIAAHGVAICGFAFVVGGRARNGAVPVTGQLAGGIQRFD